MRSSRARGIALPTLLCSLVGGAAVAVMALSGLLAVHGAAAAPAPAPAVLPPAEVVVRAPAEVRVTAAPTAPEWTATLPVATR
jgi:ABC-type transport system involved in cytochrome bd biosynthesis fused ATPase/permease subunit